MTGRAVGRRRGYSRVRRMARKTSRVTDRRGFESSLFEPEGVAQFGRRFGKILIRRIALRFIGLMTNRTAVALGGGTFQTRVDEHRGTRRLFGFVLADNINMFVVRKGDLKIRYGGFAFRRLVENLARIRKRVTRTALRRRVGMTDRADRGFVAFEKLFAVTGYTRFVARVIGDVRKGVGFPDAFPVCGRKFMTRIAIHLMFVVRKFGEFRFNGLCFGRCFFRFRFPARRGCGSFRFGRRRTAGSDARIKNSARRNREK